MVQRRGHRKVAWIGIGSLALLASACGSQDSASTSSAAGDSSSTAKVAFLMPDTGSTRYELHDRPGFEKRLKELCPGCQPLYNNADGSADKQQQQFNSALVQGAKVIVLDPVDSAAAASLVNAAHAKGVKVIAYDRLINGSENVDYYATFDNYKVGQLQGEFIKAKLAHEAGVSVISYDRLIRDSANVDFYVSFDNEAIGKAIGTSLLEKVKATVHSPRAVACSS